MALDRIGAVAGVFTDPGSDPTYLDFADDDLLELVDDGDVLLLVAYGATLGTPGDGWTERWAAGGWKAWTCNAAPLAPFPQLEAADGADDAAGVLIVYRGASPGYLVGGAAQRATSGATTHATAAATVVDPNGLRLALWLGAAGGPAPTIIPAAVDQLVSAQTSNASGGGARWFTVGEAPITSVPNLSTLTLTTGGPDAEHIAIVPLRERPPTRPARALDSPAGASLGLLP